jgi:hypothetical protein
MEITMSLARLFCLFALLTPLFAGGALAQNAVPDHRYLFSRDVDYYGSDLTNLFDTTQDACIRACSAQEDCVAFTYNSRSNACFPKSAISDQQPYLGAVSARKVLTDPQVRSNQAARLAAAPFLTLNDQNRARALVATNTKR